MTTTNIVHLEDETSLRESIRDVLSWLMPETNLQQFGNSDDAFEYVKDGDCTVHLFLLDVRVPGKMDGIGLAKQIRQLGYTCPIIFISAYPRPDRDALPDVLNYSWITKPLDLDQFLEILEHTLAHS